MSIPNPPVEPPVPPVEPPVPPIEPPVQPPMPPVQPPMPPAVSTSGPPVASAPVQSAMPTYAPAVAPTYRQSSTDLPSIVLAGGIAGLLVVLAIVNLAATSYFPSNAPVEWIWAVGISIDFFAAAIALGIRAIVIARRPRTIAPAQAAPGALSITGIVISAVVFLGWFALGGAGFVTQLLQGGDELRYYLDVNGLFFLGIPWVLGLFFGVAGYRRGKGTANNVVAIVAVALTLVLVVPTLTSAILYAMGLTD